MERLRKKLSEQESLLLLMSPNMAFRVANRNGKVSRGKNNPNLEQIYWLVLMKAEFLGSLVQIIIAPVLPPAADRGVSTA